MTEPDPLRSRPQKAWKLWKVQKVHFLLRNGEISGNGWFFHFWPPKTPKKGWARARFSARGRKSAFYIQIYKSQPKYLARGAFAKKINIFTKIMKSTFAVPVSVARFRIPCFFCKKSENPINSMKFLDFHKTSWNLQKSPDFVQSWKYQLNQWFN